MALALAWVGTGTGRACVSFGACCVRRLGPGSPAGLAFGSKDTLCKSWVTVPGEGALPLEDWTDALLGSLMALMPKAQRSKPPVLGLAPGLGRGCEPVM